MPISIKPIGAGKPDYSVEVSRSVIPTATLSQEGYWATIDMTISPYSYQWVAVEKGFDQTHETVPPGEVFYLDEYTVTTDNNVLIEIGAGNGNPVTGEIIIAGFAFGYGSASLHPRRAFNYPEGSVPLYYIANYSPYTITAHINIYGVIEVLI